MITWGIFITRNDHLLTWQLLGIWLNQIQTDHREQKCHGLLMKRSLKKTTFKRFFWNSKPEMETNKVIMVTWITIPPKYRVNILEMSLIACLICPSFPLLFSHPLSLPSVPLTYVFLWPTFPLAHSYVWVTLFPNVTTPKSIITKMFGRWEKIYYTSLLLR